MSIHRIAIDWTRNGAPFEYESFDRSHRVSFEGGQSLRNSSAPDFFGDAAQANPEELLVAALGSCHMLTFLAIAAKRGYVVDSYLDAAEGTLEKNADGRLAVTRVELRPRVEFGGERRPDASELERLHASAHRNCIIANSVSTEVIVHA
jgi:organic hydroperoxide reductase OsmC/OhrA